MEANNRNTTLTDNGPEPFVINLTRAALMNDAYRRALWTGRHLQLTLMSIKPGEEIGMEIHSQVDQFLYIAEGKGMVTMGKNKNTMSYQKPVGTYSGIVIPAGTWHNLVNTGNRSLKLFSIYAPPQHPKGTVQQ